MTARAGTSTIVIDDSIGASGGLPGPADIADAIKAAGLPATAPKTSVPNNAQQQYLIDVVTKVLLPRFTQSGKNFVLVFWSRDPDASQHSGKDSIGALQPGINGPSGPAEIMDADESLSGLLTSLRALGLDKATDVFVTADHGFSTIWRKSRTSKATTFAASSDQPSSPDGAELPAGFVAVDLADALNLPLYDTVTLKTLDCRHGQRPHAGNGYIGNDPNNPDVVVASNGGSDLIYLPGANAKVLAAQLVNILAREDYVSGLFVNDALGEILGALPTSAINLRGPALTQPPAIVVNFRSFAIPGCKPVLMCVAEVADTSLQSGQGMHGSFSRADTRNFMAAIGPDFKSRVADLAPISNADINPTLARILSLSIVPKERRSRRASCHGGNQGWRADPHGMLPTCLHAGPERSADRA